MGLQVNLEKMLNLPSAVECPHCHKAINDPFQDFDLECGDPNPKKGHWKFLMYCHECEKNFYVKAYISPIVFETVDP